VLEKRWSGRVTLDMQAPNRRRKRRGKLYFSSTKALKTSRMGKKKMALDRIETHGINKVLDFEDTEENATLSTVGESEDIDAPTYRGTWMFPFGLLDLWFHVQACARRAHSKGAASGTFKGGGVGFVL
jgi:hypothetical protein